MKTLVNFCTHAALMRALGGHKALSEALCEPYTTVASWAANGIPVRVWTAFIAVAADRCVRVTAEQLLFTRPQRAKTERRARHGRTSRASLAQGAAS
jgi:hypothetical protein